MTFDYANRDYDTIKRDLLARAERVFPDWTERDPSDFGMVLLDLWAYAADVTHYYADRAATESFLDTATQRSSVLAIANLLDYYPRGRSSAQGTVTVENTTGGDFIVAADTEFIARNNDNTYYCFAQDQVTISNDTSAPVNVGEGTMIEEEVLTDDSSGQPGQTYALASAKAAGATVRIDVYEDGVNAVPYSYVSRLSATSPGQRVFTTRTSIDNLIEIQFGSTLAGYVPPTGATITATYAATSGRLGNLPVDAVSGFKNATTPGTKVLSSTVFTGGVDEESIASMKQSIPSAVSTQDRAVTYNDFVALAQTVEGVSKATIDFTQGAGSADNTVTIYCQAYRDDYLTTSDTFQIVDTDLRTLVENVVQPRALLGTTVDTAVQVDYELIDITATVFVNAKAVNSTVDTAVNQALEELFAFDNVQFGQLLHLGQVHRIVLNVPGVDYVTVSKFDLVAGSGVQNTITVPPLELPRVGTLALTFSGGITTT